VFRDTFAAAGVQTVRLPRRSPNLKAYAERFIGSARRECLDHVIVFSATGLQRLMNLYCADYEQSFTHLPLNKDGPIHRAIAAPGDGHVVAIPQVGGLHHRYGRQAA
jgi:putative transposase